MKKATTTALIGIGRWGKNIACELNDQSNFIGYTSRSGSGATWATSTIPLARHMTLDEVCADEAVEVVVVATPIDTHAAITRRLLGADKNVLVEKPAAARADEAAHLADEAAARGLVFATGYVFLFHPVYEELKRLVGNTPIRALDCVWKKYGTFGEDIEMNLLSHHLALAYDMLGVPRSAVRTRGAGIESACDRVEATLEYDADVVFTSSIDRTASIREHTITVETDESTFIWSDNKLIELDRRGTETVVCTAHEKALSREIRAFLHGARSNDVSALPTAGHFGAQVLSIHERFTN